jgi:UTP--glucose-1-phosphate uridylyltransferase
VGGQPMILHVVKEAMTSGLDQICFVIRKGKEIIRACISSLQSEDRKENMAELSVAACEFTFVYQQRPAGLGDAVLQAADFVGDDPFVVLVPDQLMLSEVPASLQLIRHWKPEYQILSSFLRLPKEAVPYFAGARGVELGATAGGEEEFLIDRLQTEEETLAAFRDAPFELRGFGRTVYLPEIFDYLGPDFVNRRTGEVDLWKSFQSCVGKLQHRGIILEGEPLDLGTLAGYYHYLPRLQESKS